MRYSAIFAAIAFIAIVGFFLVGRNRVEILKGPTWAITWKGGGVPYSKNEPFENSLGMKFVPVAQYQDEKVILFSIWETRVVDYRAFFEGAEGVDKRWNWYAQKGEGQTADHPVMFVSWNDANSFCEWLTLKEREEGLIGPDDAYRLPLDHEWSVAMGIGEGEDAAEYPVQKDWKIKAYPWGSEWPPPKGSGNFPGWEAREVIRKPVIRGYVDDYPVMAPVGQFASNKFGLHDLSGNVFEWCENWYDESKTKRTFRGGSWSTPEEFWFRSADRDQADPAKRTGNIGFRCVLEKVLDSNS